MGLAWAGVPHFSWVKALSALKQSVNLMLVMLAAFSLNHETAAEEYIYMYVYIVLSFHGNCRNLRLLHAGTVKGQWPSWWKTGFATGHCSETSECGGHEFDLVLEYVFFTRLCV